MIKIRGYYQSVTNYELDLEMTEEEYMNLSNSEQYDLIHGKLEEGFGHQVQYIGEENFGIMYIKNFLGEFEYLFEEED